LWVQLEVRVGPTGRWACLRCHCRRLLRLFEGGQNILEAHDCEIINGSTITRDSIVAVAVSRQCVFPVAKPPVLPCEKRTEYTGLLFAVNEYVGDIIVMSTGGGK